jgi:2-desacetyl-2-hydroxyethyl bacteriochlorophyllide A dehydrogenase
MIRLGRIRAHFRLSRVVWVCNHARCAPDALLRILQLKGRRAAMTEVPIAATMLAAVANEIPTVQLDIAKVPTPSLQSGSDVIVRVEACGICGTDLHILSGESYRPVTPFVLGHESVGVAVAAGPDAREWLGRRVTMTNFTGDGTCPMCRSGDERLCPDLISITGVLGVWGGYAEYVLVHARQLIEIPAGLSWSKAASLVDCGATAANSVRVGLTRGPQRVMVLGAGPIGYMCAELLRVQGVPVQVVQPSPLRREALARIGHDVVESIDAAAKPVDVVIDCTGVASVMAPGIRALGPRGMYLLAGYARVPDMDFAQVARKEADIKGIRSGRRQDLEWIIGLSASGQIQLPEVAEWRLSAANDALAALRAKQVSGKAVIVPDSVWMERSL